MPSKVDQLLAEKARRELAERFLAETTKDFPKALAFIRDPAKRKCAFVLRRGGKTSAIAIALIYGAMTKPRTKSLYVGLTKDSAENAMWLNILEPFLLKYKIPHTFNRTKKLIEFENKSTIQLTGTDASEDQINKYLGGKYLLAAFDECQDIKHDLKHWIEDKLGPAMVDYGGTIALTGTAGRSIGRHWYDITQPESLLTSWTIHKWTGQDNPHMAALIQEEIERLKRENPGIEKTEGFRNQWLCEWVLDNTDRVYHNTIQNLLKDQELIDSLLKPTLNKWSYMVGFDFGFEDHTAFCVWAFSKYDRTAYCVETFRKQAMLTDDVAHKLYELRDRYKPIYFVGDCQNKTLVETLRQKYSLPLRAADKLGKEAHIADMNSDFTMGRIKVIEHTNKELIQEWNTLTWDEKKRLVGIFEEKASKENHAADASLYVHHFSKHFRATDPPPQDPNPMRTQVEQKLVKAINNETSYIDDDDGGIYDEMDLLNYKGVKWDTNRH